MAILLNLFSEFCKTPCIYYREDCGLMWHPRMLPLVTSIFQVLIAVCQTAHSRITYHSDHHRQHCMNFKSHLLQCSKVYYWTVLWANWALSMVSPSDLSPNNVLICCYAYRVIVTCICHCSCVCYLPHSHTHSQTHWKSFLQLNLYNTNLHFDLTTCIFLVSSLNCLLY